MTPASIRRISCSGAWTTRLGGYFPETFLLQNGVQSYDETTNTFNFAQPAATEGLQNVADLMHVHHVAPVASNLKDLGMSKHADA